MAAPRRPSPDPGLPPADPATAVAPPDLKRHPQLLRAAIVITVLWMFAMAILWLTTANPVILSRPQIAKAQFIVTASRPDPTKNRLRIERVWRGQLEPGELTVVNLDQPAPVQMPAGKSFIVPLTRARGGLKITTLEVQTAKNPPLVYPATETAIRQLQELLAESAVQP